MSEIVNLALDMGVSGWKIGHKKWLDYLLALISNGPKRDQVNGVFASETSEASIDNVEIMTDSGLRLVGNVAKFAKNSWSASGKERYLNQEFMESMTLAAMSEAKLTGKDPVTITTAVPTKWAKATVYFDGKHISIKDAITDHFTNKPHAVDRIYRKEKGKSITKSKVITVDEVRILTETHALLFSFLLDKSGNIEVENHDQMRYAVVDIGEHTTCIDVFRGLSREGEGFSSVDISMGEVHKATASQVLDRTGRNFEHWEIRDIVKAGGEIMIPARTKNKAVDSFNITSIYQENVNQLKPVLRSHFASYINNADDIHHIIVGGGGSGTIGKVIEATYEQARIVGQYATLQGLRNYGEKLCAIKNK